VGTTFLQSPIISILRTLFVLKIAIFLHCVILLQTISDFHAFHKIFNNSQTKEKNSPHKIQKSCKTLFFRIKLAFFLWKSMWRKWKFGQKNRRQRACGQIKKEEMMIKEGGLTGNSTIQFPVFYYIIRGYKMVNKL